MALRIYSIIRNQWILLLLCVVVFLSRLPFVWIGYGADEDAWGVAANINSIVHNGHYDVSRLPGNPVQDFLYLPFHIWAPVSYNIINAFFSVITFVCFALSLKEIGFMEYLKASLLLMFIPVVYIASCNSMDYILALGFMMAALLLLLKEKPIISGILLGLAIGCRITSGAFLLPMVMLIGRNDRVIRSIQLLSTACIVGLICFIPVIHAYGWGFFTYYPPSEHTPILKALYKADLGVWGVLGVLSILIAGTISIFGQSPTHQITKSTNLISSSLIAICLYAIAYCCLPQESAYLIPALPFIIILAFLYFNRLAINIFLVGVLLSPWLFSINKFDPYGGPTPSKYARVLNIEGQKTIIDPLSGPIVAEYQKQVNRKSFIEQVIQKMSMIKQPSILICGWWHNEILVELDKVKWEKVKVARYLTEQEMNDYIKQGFSIYYLPEQDYYNNIRYKQNATTLLAAPFFLKIPGKL